MRLFCQSQLKVEDVAVGFIFFQLNFKSVATPQYRWNITPCSLSSKATFHHQKRLAKSTNATMTRFVQAAFLAHALLVVMPPPLPAIFARTQLKEFTPVWTVFRLVEIVQHCATIQDGLRDADNGTCEECQGGDYAVFALIVTRICNDFGRTPKSWPPQGDMQDLMRRIVISLLRFPITPSNHSSTWRQARNNGQRHPKTRRWREIRKQSWQNSILSASKALVVLAGVIVLYIGFLVAQCRSAGLREAFFPMVNGLPKAVMHGSSQL